MGRRIMMRGDHADQRIAHTVDLVIIGDIARTDDFDAIGSQPPLDHLLHEIGPLAGGNTQKQGIWLEVFGSLQIGRKFGVGDRSPQRLHHLAAATLEIGLEGSFRIVAGAIIGDKRHNRLDVMRCTPLRHGNPPAQRAVSGTIIVRL